jgi:hypothetical protein
MTTPKKKTRKGQRAPTQPKVGDLPDADAIALMFSEKTEKPKKDPLSGFDPVAYDKASAEARWKIQLDVMEQAQKLHQTAAKVAKESTNTKLIDQAFLLQYALGMQPEKHDTSDLLVNYRWANLTLVYDLFVNDALVAIMYQENLSAPVFILGDSSKDRQMEVLKQLKTYLTKFIKAYITVPMHQLELLRQLN